MKKIIGFITTISLLSSLSTFAFPPGYAAKASKVKDNPNTFYQGVVTEILKDKTQSYIKVDGKGGSKWLGTTTNKAVKGDKIEFLRGELLKDYKSTDLNKTFKTIYMSSYIKILSTKNLPKSAVKKGSVKKSDFTVSEIFEKNKKLAGKTVEIRAKVIKFSEKIMKRNWVHIQDGTNFKNNFDLVVTTKSKVKVGDTVLLKAKVALNKDFGYGYKYPILLEEGTFKIEK